MSDAATLWGIGYLLAIAFWVGRLSVRPVPPTAEHNVGATVVEVAESVLGNLKYVGPGWSVSRKMTVKPAGKDAVWVLITTREPQP